ncbi:FAD:protein FMN transferase [Siculibacillus lacustris]|uniref:FAD:protein FMN transferase n=1 Tax=Siculibacillus lacustris TaxID=1549641 RepID=A0A4Q9VHS3_9HYPH|nr:FAD:protein FMN transferase [Siculibacillus lacustris]TBW33782.1 FAD:protein FMN transferase [Siculibacillus lacustris]
MSKTSIEPSAAGPASVRRVLSGPAMGARWSAIVYAPQAFDTADLAQALADAVEEVESQMSSWRPDSDLERLNRAPIGEWCAIPPRLLMVLERALTIGRLSEGAFDVGVGDLVRAYGFGGGRRTPDAARIAETAGRASFVPPKTLELDPVGGRARRLAPLTVDLAGIAKGYGVDRLAEVAIGFGLAAFLVGIDGELRARGTKPDGRPWAIAQERPDRAIRDVLGVIDLTDAAVATSGTYRHVVEIDGEPRSHTMDPATGRPLRGDLVQVSVVAPDCTSADAWATALLVMGRDRGLAFARRLGLSAILVGADGATQSTL